MLWPMLYLAFSAEKIWKVKLRLRIKIVNVKFLIFPCAFRLHLPGAVPLVVTSSALLSGFVSTSGTFSWRES